MIPHDHSVEAIGTRIARCRSQFGWTQQRLAEKIALSRVAVAHLESGLSTPSERTIVLLAGLFQYEPHQFVEGTNYPIARAERLPLVACWYTQVEMECALMERDLAWSKLLGPTALRSECARWRQRLEHLEGTTDDLDQRKLIEQARAKIRVEG